MFPVEILIRLSITIALILLGIAGWALANRLLLWRAAKNALPQPASATPRILYFTTPTCAPCKTYQRPAIEQVKQSLGSQVEVVEIDASSQPELASQWGVLSVPTTFILDAQGHPRHVNHGLTSAAKLLQQLQIS